MAKSKTPFFVTTMPLLVDSKQESELLARFQASRQLYNACLNEAMTRMDLVKKSDIYQAAKKLPREQKKQRSNMFSEARKIYRYSDYDLQGQFITFSTQKTALSQTHLDGSRIKKSLSQRVHRDVTGITMHRDIFSAFLSRYVNEDRLSFQDAQCEYPGLEQTLWLAWQQYQTNCEQVGESESRLTHSSSEQFNHEGKSVNQIAVKSEKLA